MTNQQLRTATFVALGAMVIGAIGPWAQVTVFGTTVSANGFDRDGALVLIAAAVVLFVLLTGRYPMLGLIAAGVSAAVCIYDYFDIAGTQGVSVGWGLWLALLASIAESVFLVMARKRARQAHTLSAGSVSSATPTPGTESSVAPAEHPPARGQ